MQWKPHVTVAAIIEREGRFLMVEEAIEGRLVLNQPAGHLEDGESLFEAVVRETREETGFRFTPRAVVGLYRWPSGDRTYLRIVYAGNASSPEQGQTLDAGIVRTVWLNAEELAGEAQRLRSPLVMQAVQDYLAGRRYPLDLVRDIP
jgi:8-oxo-dGTP pyrophosphatase MutT (NUDIX family)